MRTFQQSTGQILRPDWTLLTVGYAGGDCGMAPSGKNNPAMQNLHNIGPLPQGKYVMVAVEDHPKLGPFTIVLVPDPANVMYGRSLFRIHGDSIKSPGNASDGCIVCARFAREELWASSDHDLQVIQ